MSTYTMYRAAGWHGEPNDPVITTTDDEREAALRAGCRIDISMPGGSNKYDAYALDEDGDEIDRIEAFRCDSCAIVYEWGDYGPIGAMDGRILECPESVEKHLVTWLCDDCAAEIQE